MQLLRTSLGFYFEVHSLKLVLRLGCAISFRLGLFGKVSKVRFQKCPDFLWQAILYPHFQQYTAQNTDPTKLEYVTDRIGGMLWERRKILSCIG